MAKKTSNVLRGLGLVSIFVLSASVVAGTIMEFYRDPMDQFFGTVSSTIVTDETDEGTSWNYKSNYKTAKEAVEGYKQFALKEARNTMALLKNDNNALPISKTAKITLYGVRSFAPVYGNSAGSIADIATTTDNQLVKCFTDAGFKINPSMLAAYQKNFEGQKFGGSGFGATPPEYSSITKTNDSCELSPAELKTLNSAYDSQLDEYNDAAIVVFGRPGGESKNYYLGAEGLAAGVTTDTGNIMGITAKEKEILDLAKAHAKKVIVLINSTATMEIGALKDDDGVDAIMWIGFPGAYGCHALAELLNGTCTPNARLGDTFARNAAASAAMQNFGDIPWTNAKTDFTSAENVNSYLIQAEGIYSGYRYYETRYEDVVNGKSNASQAKAGSWTTKTGTLGTTDGTWDYKNEVVYPFGYGISYTTFQQTLDSVKIKGDKKFAEVTVTVKNTGNVKGKDVVQLYAQTPYTENDVTNKIEKSAIQLMDFEKTVELEPGKSQTIKMKVDLANLASYDAFGAKTYIVDKGDYYFALGRNAHDALNNVLIAKNKPASSLYSFDGAINETNAKKCVYKWSWEYDATTFSVSTNGTPITNKLTEGDYAMDFNAFKPGTVTYLTRNNWNGTFPKTYEGLKAEGKLLPLLKNDFIQLKDENTSEYVFGKDSKLTLNDLKGADWDDPRWEELVDKVTVSDFLDFAANAFHHIQKIDSVGYLGNNADDGPGGADTHYFNEGTYEGTKYADADDYKAKEGQSAGYGTRVCPSQQNLAYGFDKELAYENGEIIIGETSLILNLPIIIGPGMNLHRHGYNGRGGEYYSEDPMLSGYIGSASVQGAQSKGCIVNIKHAAFNDQEINRSGIAIFSNEQKAREMELRNLQQAFEGKGKPAAWENDNAKANTYTEGAWGVMTSYNRIGAVASSANKAVQQDIMRDEWGFIGYNVTDFTGVSLKAAPKESILFGTTAFCGFGSPSLDYWKKGASGIEEKLSKDKDMCAAMKKDIKYVLYVLARSNALNGVTSSSRKVELETSWRTLYKVATGVSAAVCGLSFVGYVVLELLGKKREED